MSEGGGDSEELNAIVVNAERSDAETEGIAARENTGGGAETQEDMERAGGPASASEEMAGGDTELRRQRQAEEEGEESLIHEEQQQKMTAAGGGEGDKNETNEGEQAEHGDTIAATQRENIEMENGIVTDAGVSDVECEDAPSDQIIRVAVDSDGEESDYEEKLKIRNQGGLSYPDHDYDPYDPEHRYSGPERILPKCGPLDEEAREIYPVNRETGEPLDPVNLPPGFDKEYRDRPLLTPAWRDHLSARRQAQLAQDGSTLVEGPMDRLNIQQQQQGVKSTPLSVQRFHGVALPQVGQFTPLGSVSRHQGIVKKFPSATQPVPGSMAHIQSSSTTASSTPRTAYTSIATPGTAHNKQRVAILQTGQTQGQKKPVIGAGTQRDAATLLLSATGARVQNRTPRDQPIHRMMAPGSVPSSLPPRGQPPVPVTDTPPHLNYQGRAPMLVSASGTSSRERINGRAGGAQANRRDSLSRGRLSESQQMDDSNVMVETLESGRRVASSSPRKQVTFSESGDVSTTSPFSSPNKSHRLAPGQLPAHRLSQQQLLNMQAQVHDQQMQQQHRVATHMPHKTTTMSPASFTTTSLASSSGMSAADALPDNIMDDSPKSANTAARRMPVEDSVLPPQVSEAAMALSAGSQQMDYGHGQADKKKELNEEDIKKKIAAIQQEIQMEAEQKRQEEMRASASRLPGSSHFGSHFGQSPYGTGQAHTQQRSTLRYPQSGYATNGYGNDPSAPAATSSSVAKMQSPPYHHRNTHSPLSAGNRPPPPYVVGHQARTTLGKPPTLPKNLSTPSPYTAVAKPAAASAKSESSTPRIHLPRDKKASFSGKKDKKKAGRKPKAQEEFTSEGQEFNSEDEDASDTARCYCGMTHYCGWFMIECDKCNMWEHGDCVSVDEANQPDKYLCTTCKPRRMKLTKEQAKQLQQKKLDNYYEKKRAFIQARAARRSSSGRQDSAKSRSSYISSDTSERASSSASKMASHHQQPRSGGEFRYIAKNEYSREVRKTIGECPETAGAADVLRQVGETVLAKKMFVTTNVQGLVSTSDIENNNVVMKYVGYICLPWECPGRTPGKNLLFVTLYDGLVKEMTDNEKYIVCSDARSMGNDARFARKVCTPNCVLKHIIHNGELYIFLVATCHIKKGSELTIPFDRDFRESTEQICFCKQPDCKIEKDRLMFQASRSLSRQSPPFTPSSTTTTTATTATRRSLPSLPASAAAPVPTTPAPVQPLVTSSGRTSRPTTTAAAAAQASAFAEQTAKKRPLNKRESREAMDMLGFDFHSPPQPAEKKARRSESTKETDKKKEVEQASASEKRKSKVEKRDSNASSATVGSEKEKKQKDKTSDKDKHHKSLNYSERDDREWEKDSAHSSHHHHSHSHAVKSSKKKVEENDSDEERRRNELRRKMKEEKKRQMLEELDRLEQKEREKKEKRQKAEEEEQRRREEMEEQLQRERVEKEADERGRLIRMEEAELLIVKVKEERDSQRVDESNELKPHTIQSFAPSIPQSPSSAGSQGTRRSTRVSEAVAAKAEKQAQTTNKEGAFEKDDEKPLRLRTSSASVSSPAVAQLQTPTSTENLSKREQMKIERMAKQEKQEETTSSRRKSTPGKKLTGFDKLFAEKPELATPSFPPPSTRKRGAAATSSTKENEAARNELGQSQTQAKRPRRDTAGSSSGTGAGAQAQEVAQSTPAMGKKALLSRYEAEQEKKKAEGKVNEEKKSSSDTATTSSRFSKSESRTSSRLQRASTTAATVASPTKSPTRAGGQARTMQQCRNVIQTNLRLVEKKIVEQEYELPRV